MVNQNNKREITMQNEILKAKVDIDDKIKLKNSNPDSLMYYLSALYIVLFITVFHQLYFKGGVGLLKSIIISIIFPPISYLIIPRTLRLADKVKYNFPHLTSCLPSAIIFAYLMYHVKKYY